MALPTIVSRRSGLNFAKQRGSLPFIQDLNTLTGNVFFVMSGGTDTAGHGLHPDDPFATVDFAIGQCTANQGDRIYVMPGYTETITNSDRWTVDVAGIEIIGLGLGSTKPTITFGTDTTADILVSADNIRINNFRLVSDINSLVNFIDSDEDFLYVEKCDFVTSSAKEAITFIDIATTKDNFFFKGCTFLQPTDPAGTDGDAGTGCINMVDSENIYVEDCYFHGNFETAIFHNKTTKCRNLWVTNCFGIQLLSGAEPFQLVTDADGAMVGGGFITPNEGAASEATLVGTIGNKFFILAPGNFGNDGGAGGQGGIVVATAS